MDASIDWVSFSAPMEPQIMSVSDLYNWSKSFVSRIGEGYNEYIFDGTSFDTAVGRAPYRFAISRADNGVRIFGGGHLASILYELSGRACAGLRKFEDAQLFIAGIVDGLTRLDIAVDVRCDTLPSEFANVRSSSAFRSVQFIRSDKGETVYIGSPKSDRFARVYRYNKPHPRSGLLRIEFVFRRHLAKDTAKKFLDEKSYPDFIAKLGNSWGWAHPVWQPGSETDEKMSVPTVNTNNQDTVHWLYAQVAPAVARLMKEESLNLTDWLEHIYTL